MIKLYEYCAFEDKEDFIKSTLEIAPDIKESKTQRTLNGVWTDIPKSFPAVLMYVPDPYISNCSGNYIEVSKEQIENGLKFEIKRVQSELKKLNEMFGNKGGTNNE